MSRDIPSLPAGRDGGLNLWEPDLPVSVGKKGLMVSPIWRAYLTCSSSWGLSVVPVSGHEALACHTLTRRRFILAFLLELGVWQLEGALPNSLVFLA